MTKATDPARPGSPSNEPQRTCVGCRAKRPQSALVRFVAGADGQPIESRSGNGRGAWLCRDTREACEAAAHKTRAFARSLNVRRRI